MYLYLLYEIFVVFCVATNNVWINHFEVTKCSGRKRILFVDFHYNNQGFRKEQGDSLRAIAYLLTKHKEIKVDYFSKRYLEEKINRSELKNYLDRYEEELEDRKKI